MTITETRFLNILAQPEEKSGFTGLLAAAHYYLHVGETDRAELRSLMHAIASKSSPTNAEEVLYVILATKDRRFEPTLRLIAARRVPLADMAEQVLENDITSWSDSPSHREWVGDPLSAFDLPPQILLVPPIIIE